MAVKKRTRGWFASGEVQRLHLVTARLHRRQFRAWLQPPPLLSSGYPISIEQESLEICCLHAWKGVAPLKL